MDEEIKKLLEQNLKLTQEIYFMTRKIKGHLAFQRLVSIFYLILIVAPIILSIIFLPPLVKDYLGQYQELLGGDQAGGGSIQSLLNGATGGLDLKNMDINKLPAEVKALLKK